MMMMRVRVASGSEWKEKRDVRKFFGGNGLLR